MLSSIKNPIVSQNMKQEDEDDHSVEGLLFDLEVAIKKRVDSNKHDENFDLDHSFENEKEEKNKDDDVEFDEDFVLKEIEFCENDEEMKELLEMEESKLVFSNENSYKFLYKKSLQKSFIMMKIIKGFLNKSQVMSHLKEQCQDLTKKLEAQIKENLSIKREKNELKENKDEIQKKLKLMTQKYDEKKSDLRLYEGDPKALMNLDIATILDLEKKFQESISNIAEFKTKLIKELTQDLQESKDKLKDNKNCLICQMEPINCLIKPCNHACVCTSCIKKLEECPLDRQKIIEFEKIYL